MLNKQIVIIGYGQEITYELLPAIEHNGFPVRHFISAEHFFNTDYRPTNVIYFVDHKLSQISGTDVIRTIRLTDKLSNIIMLLDSNDSDSIIAGFKNGADCFIVKPLYTREIIERIKSAHIKLNIIRRSVKVQGLNLFPETCSVVNNGASVDLTPREFKLFKCLSKDLGTVCTREFLVDDLKGEKGMAVRNIDVHIFSLRKKLEKINMIVETVWKVGYRIKILDT